MADPDDRPDQFEDRQPMLPPEPLDPPEPLGQADDDLDPDDPEDDLERVLRALLGMAVDLLRRKGRFFPFGAVVWADSGDLQLVAAPPPTGKGGATDDELVRALVSELQVDARAGRLRAVGICRDIRAGRDSAIRSLLEQVDGYATVATCRYERRFPRRFVVDTNADEQPGAPLVFAPSAS